MLFNFSFALINQLLIPFIDFDSTKVFREFKCKACKNRQFQGCFATYENDGQN